MEKRTILAFALSFLILLIWSFLFAPKQEQAPTKGKPQKKDDVTVSESAEAPALKPKPPGVVREEDQTVLVPKIGTEEKQVKVETPLYEAIISNAGGSIKSFKLKKYRVAADADAPLVELVNMKKEGESLLNVSFNQPSKQGAKRLFYHVSDESLILDAGSSPRDLIFSAVTPDGLSIRKIFRIYPDRYPIDLLVSFSNNTEKDIRGNLKASISNLPPEKKKSYYSFVGLSLLLDDALEEMEPKKLKEEKRFQGRIGWIAYEEDYFLTAIIPEDHSEANFSGHSLPSGIITGTYTSPPVSLGSRNQLSSHFTLYMGPRDVSILKQIGKNLDLAIDFGWFDIIAKPLLYSLRFFNQYVHNYGVSIIILTVLIKILFWPLTHKSYKSMKEMQKLQPLMAKIREKYKNDKQQMNKELMGLYKTYKVNPMGGCLPMVIQIPVFFALFRILGSAIELRHAPFMLWITDLSAPDRLFHFPFKIPFMSPPYGIPVLTLLMGLSMLIQQKMTPTPGDPTQAKVMMFLPLIFTVLFINFPSGLVLYWLINNVLSIGQQYRIIKKSA
ncbi:MAG: membrane protein insertase YidC [Desulfobacteraceae bacterium]|jgi:YidC/Oxa1 family membrane protein insertase